VSGESTTGQSPPRAVVALGGNALLARGEPLEIENQERAAGVAAGLLARVSTAYRLIVTHGNGPQVGLLALMATTYSGVAPYPLDVLDAETEGQIGYVIELELSNAIAAQDTVTVLTRVLVDADDPAFSAPSKFIGPVYTESEARAVGDEHGWTVAPDGSGWRRVVPSPEPRRIIQLRAIEQLVDGGFLVICAGGGGIPVIEDRRGRQLGVEAVVDKDLASALLAIDLAVDVLVLATDVDAVYDDYGTPQQRAIVRATPAGLRSRRFPAGSMGPKVEAVCRFVERTGGRGVIGSLDQVDRMFRGIAGTQVVSTGPELTYEQMEAANGRPA
jgi:carbamate kinase